jgi:hypothetical protein
VFEGSVVPGLLIAPSMSRFETAPAFSQGAPQTVSLIRVDLEPLASGYRTFKVTGGDAANEANEKVGKIDDLIVTSDEKVPVASILAFIEPGLGKDSDCAGLLNEVQEPANIRTRDKIEAPRTASPGIPGHKPDFIPRR